MRSRSTLTIRILVIFFFVIWVSFIFGNSFLTGRVSSDVSNLVMSVLQNIIDFIRIPVQLSLNFVRNIAHLTEFAVLGISLMVILSIFTERLLKNITVPLFLGLLIPVIDEFIQLSVNGRSSSIIDIVIDFSGVLIGIVLYIIVTYIFRGTVNKNVCKNKIQRR